MHCPRDATPLKPFTIDGITTDSCPTCRGVWLDATELTRVTNDDELEQLARARTQAGTLSCPRCAAKLHAARIEGVEVDPCPSCRGVWLDAGELREAQKQVLAKRWTNRRSGLAAFASRA